jgi:hypothetical protein
MNINGWVSVDKDKRIAELEKALDLLLRHRDSIELSAAFKYGLEIMGRDTYYGGAERG